MNKRGLSPRTPYPRNFFICLLNPLSFILLLQCVNPNQLNKLRRELMGSVACGAFSIYRNRICRFRVYHNIYIITYRKCQKYGRFCFISINIAQGITFIIHLRAIVSPPFH